MNFADDEEDDIINIAHVSTSTSNGSNRHASLNGEGEVQSKKRGWSKLNDVDVEDDPWSFEHEEAQASGHPNGNINPNINNDYHNEMVSQIMNKIESIAGVYNNKSHEDAKTQEMQLNASLTDLATLMTKGNQQSLHTVNNFLDTYDKKYMKYFQFLEDCGSTASDAIQYLEKDFEKHILSKQAMHDELNSKTSSQVPLTTYPLRFPVTDGRLSLVIGYLCHIYVLSTETSISMRSSYAGLPVCLEINSPSKLITLWIPDGYESHILWISSIWTVLQSLIRQSSALIPACARIFRLFSDWMIFDDFSPWSVRFPASMFAIRFDYDNLPSLIQCCLQSLHSVQNAGLKISFRELQLLLCSCANFMRFGIYTIFLLSTHCKCTLNDSILDNYILLVLFTFSKLSTTQTQYSEKIGQLSFYQNCQADRRVMVNQYLRQVMAYFEKAQVETPSSQVLVTLAGSLLSLDWCSLPRILELITHFIFFQLITMPSSASSTAHHVILLEGYHQLLLESTQPGSDIHLVKDVIRLYQTEVELLLESEYFDKMIIFLNKFQATTFSPNINQLREVFHQPIHKQILMKLS